MRVPISWLKEFVDIPVALEILAQRLTFSGLEVSAIEYVGLPGGELPWDPAKVLVCNILEVSQHPNADKLVLARVDYGGQEHTVVTGAPNLYPYKGAGPLTHPLKSVFAKEGAELYDGHADGKVKVKLKGRPVRGVMSDAMLCSEKELGMSEEHEGILILPDDAPVGAPLAEYLGDAVLEIDILPNTARCLSVYGVAREIAGLYRLPLRPPQQELVAAGPPVEGRVRVTIADPEQCPRFTAALIEGITIGPSPYWMQRRLTLAGMRPISNIVDVTNYVMLELGEPSHAFDADKVAGAHLIVRSAAPGETLTTLDNKQRDLQGREIGQPLLLVCDEGGPSSLAGVMGGLASEISATTTRVLLEAAIWNPVTIRKTATALNLRSEASRRFERGVDYNLPPVMQRRALALMQQVAGGTVAAGLVDVYPRPWQPVSLLLPPAEVLRIVGIERSAAQIAELLTPLGFGCVLEGDAVRVDVPSFRLDVMQLADLCEEVARMVGYEQIPETLMADALPVQTPQPRLALEQRVRDLLVNCGLDEALTYTLSSMASVAKLSPAAAEPAQYLRLLNALSPEREYLRRSLLPTLLEALAANVRERERVQLFEVGRVYLPRAGATLPDEPRRLAIVLTGQRAVTGWLTPQPAALDFFDLKGVVETLLARLQIGEQLGFVALSADERFHPGRAAQLVVRAGGASCGVLGELHPAVAERLGLSGARVLAAELELDTLITLAQPARYEPISRFPAASQDLAFIVPAERAAAEVAAAIRKYAGGDLETLTLFDVYEGERMEPGKRSLAYRLVFRRADRTLADADLTKVRQKIIRGVQHDVGGVLRA